MYMIDDICYAGELVKGIKVTEVQVLQDKILLITFSTGEKRLLDVTELKGSAFNVLSDEKIFNQPKLHQGVITWNDGQVDIAPEMVYAKSYPYTAKEIA
jgi:hypothetical protein